jgi:predicted phage terminase large subunit-like protein
MLKRHWWRYWKPKGTVLPPVTVKLPNGDLENIEAIDLPDSMETTLQSWDLTFKDTPGTDFVAGGVWGNKGSGIFYLDQIYERMDIVATIQAIKSMTEKWPEATMKLIEDKANGPAVISMLRLTINGLIAVQPKGSKLARASAVSPLMEAGNVFLPHPMVHPWTNLFIEQCAAFPNGKNDDLVDECSQALGRFLHAIVPEDSKEEDDRLYPEEDFDDYNDGLESFFD